MPINQPSNQIKLTNVAVVRLRKGKKRFELACYKNKVLEYRAGTETDLDEVLQISQVFTNVSKGSLASKSDLTGSFGASTPLNDIILEILTKGELQVGEKERSANLSQLHNEVISIIASKCVDPNTGRVYPTTMIDKALTEARAKELWSGVKDGKSAKALALEGIRALVKAQIVPIARARMRVRVVIGKAGKDKVKEYVEKVVEEEMNGGDWVAECDVEPGRFKELVELVKKESKGKGRVEVLETAVVHEGENDT
ncbi:Shwachman-Bodian-diamond syndrome protein [Ascodesmis nigricans]|uniref:Shwachman-Bodian-diamond syndrome protein n=1 Tax=Ascodesmis nigricans TaxID=341454 RepID=A0A4S2N572_9PEZI|nr:Shwachman-Bodian-diamond syndrome protein [Ascodesmis nigricans]